MNFKRTTLLTQVQAENLESKLSRKKRFQKLLKSSIYVILFLKLFLSDLLFIKKQYLRIFWKSNHWEGENFWLGGGGGIFCRYTFDKVKSLACWKTGSCIDQFICPSTFFFLFRESLLVVRWRGSRITAYVHSRIDRWFSGWHVFLPDNNPRLSLLQTWRIIIWDKS